MSYNYCSAIQGPGRPIHFQCRLPKTIKKPLISLRNKKSTILRKLQSSGELDELERAKDFQTNKKELLDAEKLRQLSDDKSDIAAAAAPGSPNAFQGVIEEIQLIDWPPFGKAVLQTLLVIFMVTISSLMLFALNTFLNDISQWFYSTR